MTSLALAGTRESDSDKIGSNTGKSNLPASALFSRGEDSPEASADHTRWMSVKNAMSTEVISILPTDRLMDAWVLMMETGVSSIPVVDGVNAIIGVLSVTDINRHIADRVEKARSLRELTSQATDPTLEDKEEMRELILAIRAVAESTVASILPKDQRIFSLSPDDSFDRAIHMMAEHNVNMLPVVRDARVVGVVTRQDVIWVIAGRAGKHHP